MHKQIQHPFVGALGNAEHQVQRGQQAHDGLPEIFLTRAHALRVLVDHFAPVVDPADGTKTQGHDEHNPDKAVGQVKPQDRRDGNGQQDQDTPHGGRAAFGQMRWHAVAADGLTNFERGQTPNDPRPGGQTNQQGGHRRHHGAECDVLEDAQKSPFGRQTLQPLGQAKQHGPPLLCCFAHRPLQGPWPARPRPHAPSS